MPQITQTTAFSDFAAAVLNLYRPPIRRISTFRKMEQALEEFAILCPSTADIGPCAIAAWIAAHPSRAPLTGFTLLRTFRSACRAGIALGMLALGPFGFRGPRAWWPAGALASPLRDRWHPAGEISGALALADLEALQPPSSAPGACWRARRLRAVFYTAAFTGARAREVLGLRTDDIDLPGGIIHVRPNARRPLKTAASRAALPIPSELGLVLAGWLPSTPGDWFFPGATGRGPWMGGPCGYRPVDQLRRLGDRAGVPGLTFQSLRHSYATPAEGWGIGELALRRLLRHSRASTQLHYRHEDLAAMRAAADKVHFD